MNPNRAPMPNSSDPQQQPRERRPHLEDRDLPSEFGAEPIQ